MTPIRSTAPTRASEPVNSRVPSTRVGLRPQLSRLQPTSGRVASPLTAATAMIVPICVREASRCCRYSGNSSIDE